jgi:propionyl-CoA synthetase
VRALSDDGQELSGSQIGNIVIKLPLPPGCLPTLWNNDEGFQKSYLSRYSGYYLTADAGYKDEDGYLWIMSRTDDIINVAGHRLSTGAMEEVLASHPDVAECAVLGADAPRERFPGLSLSRSARLTTIVAEVSRWCARGLARWSLQGVWLQLPKTRSGKISRGTIKRLPTETTGFHRPSTIRQF